jgi:hypothetical protein
MKLKLTEEQKEALLELLNSEGEKVLRNAIIPSLLRQMEQRFLTVRIDDPTSIHTLAFEKARLEGAQSMARMLEEFLKGYRKSP